MISNVAQLEGLKLRQMYDNYIRVITWEGSLYNVPADEQHPDVLRVFEALPTFVCSAHGGWEGNGFS